MARRKKKIPVIAFHDTSLELWEERDRLHIALEDSKANTIAEWWDDDARQMFDDGFFEARDLHFSVYEYCAEVGLLVEPEAAK